MNDQSDISNHYGAVFSLQKFFWKAFVQYVTVWFVRIWTYKNVDEKEHIVCFHGEEKA